MPRRHSEARASPNPGCSRGGVFGGAFCGEEMRAKNEDVFRTSAELTSPSVLETDGNATPAHNATECQNIVSFLRPDARAVGAQKTDMRLIQLFGLS